MAVGILQARRPATETTACRRGAASPRGLGALRERGSSRSWRGLLSVAAHGLCAATVRRGYPRGRGSSQQAEEAFRYLGPRLAEGFDSIGQEYNEGLCRAFLEEAARVVDRMLSSRGPAVRKAMLDGLVDLRPPGSRESPPRTRRKRIHQALLNLCRYLLDDEQRLKDLASQGSTSAMRRFVPEVMDEKRRLRQLSRRFGQLHQEVLRASGRPAPLLAQLYRDAARENMRKRWNVAFHEWCVEAICHYYLLDPELRERWLAEPGRRSRVSVLSSDHLGPEVLPSGPLKLLDLGSCANYFAGRAHFDVTAVDLAPAEETVLRGDVLELTVGPVGSEPVFKDGCLVQLPAKAFHVAVLALLLSYMPEPLDRARVLAKVRQLLQEPTGLLIIADTVPTLGRYSEGLPPWTSTVEAAGYRLLHDRCGEPRQLLLFRSLWRRWRSAPGCAPFGCEHSGGGASKAFKAASGLPKRSSGKAQRVSRMDGHAIWDVLLVPPELQGKVEYPCYPGACMQITAPVMTYIDALNASLLEWERNMSKAAKKRTLVMGIVRNPLTMVASAYCYHHHGQEMQNLMFDVQRLKVLGPDEGTTATAEMLLPVVEWMTSAFAEPDGDTLRLRYEDFERSSDSFDREVDKLLDFFFAASSSPAWAAPLISEGERSIMQSMATTADLRRAPFLAVSGPKELNHTNDEACEGVARRAAGRMEPSILKKYQEFQRRLGYRIGSA
ncbi:unnamed protein product [Durusdinium trenchii]|uniref:Uncharacterized protein n=1 Tax=Durusdinium trenchii TaxID=1381693 RepID=A0ABP0N4P0_9DINO